MKLQAPATISKVLTMSDKTIRLNIDCQEMPPEEEAKIFELRGKLGWFLFADQLMKVEDVKDLPEIKVEKGQKTPSERLRSVIFVFWEQNGAKGDFDSFYRGQIEKIINRIKEELNQ